MDSINNHNSRQLLEQLKHELEQESAILTQACRITASIYLVLTNGKLIDLNQKQVEQEEITLQLRHQALRRQLIVEALVEYLHLPKGVEYTLRDLISHFPIRAQEHFFDLSLQIQKELKHFQEIQSRNATLIETLRSYFRSVISDLSDTATLTRYDLKGQRVGATSSVVIHASG